MKISSENATKPTWMVGQRQTLQILGTRERLDFFDFYIIPLAKKLKECGVFGVSSDEYLSYAEQNRKEWEQRGEEIVQDMIQKVEEQKNGIMVLG
mmetsp:Transcript_18388/g.32420  ORF Transcript_18388/g.32420 Transcript_18388/m.32420 type:complete len:95 (-) Transcript_18388:65-349(-)